MLWTRTLIPTLKETPEGAEIPSHVLMLRAGLVEQVMGGAYAYLPLGLRSLRKAKRIVRREMDAAGAIETAMPALSPTSLWERSGRLEAFGDALVRLSLPRRNRKVRAVLATAHEEVFTDLMARHVSSYRQLPLTLYQITTKFRNEERPRLGVLRTSEFLAKDAYSFHATAASLDESYRKTYAAYCRIFGRCAVEYLAAEAEEGPAGGGHEFVIPAQNGEHSVLHCRMCGYTASPQRAEVGARDVMPPDTPAEKLQKVDTPGCTTVEQVSRFLGCRPRDLIKTLLYVADGRPVAVLIRGDHEANEGKIRRAIGAERLEMAGPEVIERVTGAPVGFAGPVDLPTRIPLWADRDLQQVTNAVTGANQADAHLTGVNLNRDFRVDHFADLRAAVDGDPCPRCSSTLSLRRAIKVGHLSRIGPKYSEILGARFLDENEQQRPILLGCYRLGINRLLAAVVETSHDADGIIWPLCLAPYEVLLLPLSVTDEQTMGLARQLYDELTAAGIDVLMDDRDARPGVKFKDADLIGIPLRVVIGQRGLQQGKLEVKWRRDEDRRMIDLDTAAATIAGLIAQERQDGSACKAATDGLK